MRATLPSISLPSLHLISDADPTLSLSQLHSLPSRCVGPVVLVHPHGHTLPRLAAAPLGAKVDEFLRGVVAAAAAAGPSSVGIRSTAASAASAATAGDVAAPRKLMSDAFLWRKMVERQQRWFARESAAGGGGSRGGGGGSGGGGGGSGLGGGLGGGGQPLYDDQHRFVPTAANPLPQLSPQDKLMQRAYLDARGVPQPRLLATIRHPEELARLELPSSWALKPVGAAYSEGLVLVRDGRDALTGLPWNMWDVVSQLRRVQAKHGEDAGGGGGGGGCSGGGGGGSGGHGGGHVSGGSGGGGVGLDPRQGDASQHMRYNCGCFLIEELVKCEHGASKPVDYRVYVCGDAVLWIELTLHDPVLSTSRQARRCPVALRRSAPPLCTLRALAVSVLPSPPRPHM